MKKPIALKSVQEILKELEASSAFDSADGAAFIGGLRQGKTSERDLELVIGVVPQSMRDDDPTLKAKTRKPKRFKF